MTSSDNPETIVSALALVLAIIAFVLGSGPLHASLFLAVVAFPVALISLFLGPWRISAIALYWAVAAIAPIPAAHAFSMQVDHMLVVLGSGGVVVSAIFCFSYVRNRPLA